MFERLSFPGGRLLRGSAMTRTVFAVVAAACVGIAAPVAAQTDAQPAPAQQTSETQQAATAANPSGPPAASTAATAAEPNRTSPATSPDAELRGGELDHAVVRPEHRFTLGVAQIGYSSFFRSASDPWVGEASWGWLVRPDVLSAEVGGGLRFTARREGVDVPLEAFVRARFEAELFGYWRPAAGPELGVSGLARFSPRADLLPSDLDVQEARRLSPFYAGIDVAPLRFRFGRVQV